MRDRKIIIANPHGFCQGVRRAIDTAEAALKRFEPPLYCLHEIVHNGQVVDELTEKGVRFVRDLNEVPERSNLLFSAHGVSPAVRNAAERKRLKIIDATCPFVSKVHMEARRFAGAGCSVVIIGHRSHEEVIGVAGEAPGNVEVVENEEEASRIQPPDPEKIGVVCQTTLSVSYANRIIGILRSRFPLLRTPPISDICYATQNRQRAVRAIAKKADMILVLGSRTSANTRRLAEVAESSGCVASLIDTSERLKNLDLSGIKVLGLTSGASTPESFVQAAVEYLRTRGFTKTEYITVAEESAKRFPAC